MCSVNPTPGEYKIALTLGIGKGGMKRRTESGTILCGGIFGLRYDIEWTLTHIGTGRTAGHYTTRRKAYEAAAQLAALKLPWDAKSLKEWNERRDDDEGEKAVEIIKRLGRR
jgi:hypothetical protein